MKMKQSLIFNCVGTALIVFAVTLHIVCLATPYFSEADLNDIGKKMADLVSKDQSLLGSLGIPGQGGEQPMSKVANVLEGFLAIKGNINFGLWKLCAKETVMGTSVDTCIKWGTETSFDPQTGVTAQLESGGWMRAAQAMAIIGVLIGGAALVMAIVNLVVRSKGDRLRLIHIFIACTCVVAGLFMLVGALVVAANYKDAMDPMVAGQVAPPPPEVMELITEPLHLSWGFALDIVAVALMLLSGLAHLMGGRIALGENGVV